MKSVAGTVSVLHIVHHSKGTQTSPDPRVVFVSPLLLTVKTIILDTRIITPGITALPPDDPAKYCMLWLVATITTITHNR